jgi:hypothetical protein
MKKEAGIILVDSEDTDIPSNITTTLPAVSGIFNSEKSTSVSQLISFNYEENIGENNKCDIVVIGPSIVKAKNQEKSAKELRSKYWNALNCK